MEFSLDETQRKECSIEELARIIFRFVKEETNGRMSRRMRTSYGLKHMQETLYPGNRPGYVADDQSFCLKFYEAVARLKQRGLLMDADSQCFGSTSADAVCLTSVGEKSDFDEGILILIDDAYEVVQTLKNQAHNLDPVVEQYYLESLRTCQTGCYISSAICLGAASERTIRCLAEALVQSNPQCKHDIDNKQNISALTRHLLDNAAVLFKSLDAPLRNELKEKLKGLANIYRLNRNEAGHPSNVEQDWKRDEQECYLSQFRRLATTCFKSIDALDSANTNNMSGQST